MNLNQNDRITGVAKLIKVADDENTPASVDDAAVTEIPVETQIIAVEPENNVPAAEENSEPEA
jgi:hypothetical protein